MYFIHLRRIAATLVVVPFAAFGQPDSASSESGNEKITLQAFRVMPNGKVIAKFLNTSGKPVKAFRGKWSVFNDFNEVSRSGDILFTSETVVLRDQVPVPRYILPPNGIIYLLEDGKQKAAMVGSFASEAFGNLEAVPGRPVRMVITDVVFAPSAGPSADDQTTEPRVDTVSRPKNNAGDDSAVVTERVNSFYEKYQTPNYAVVEAGLRVEYLTERFRRERAEEDKHPENMDGDSYTLSDGGWDVGRIRVVDVKIQGSHAEASVSRGGTNHNMKVSLVKERGKWMIDRIYFAR